MCSNIYDGGKVLFVDYHGLLINDPFFSSLSYYIFDSEITNLTKEHLELRLNN